VHTASKADSFERALKIGRLAGETETGYFERVSMLAAEALKESGRAGDPGALSPEELAKELYGGMDLRAPFAVIPLLSRERIRAAERAHGEAMESHAKAVEDAALAVLAQAAAAATQVALTGSPLAAAEAAMPIILRIAQSLEVK
jgi:hypothetical protein